MGTDGRRMQLGQGGYNTILGGSESFIEATIYVFVTNLFFFLVQYKR